MKQYNYKTQGVCAGNIIISVEDDIIKEVKFMGGCPGNLIGIGKLVQGRKMSEVASELSGIKCGNKATSCPDQLSKALTAIIEQKN